MDVAQLVRGLDLGILKGRKGLTDLLSNRMGVREKEEPSMIKVFFGPK